ncbi:hypothetical protein ACIQWN_37555 [Streptomyces vinaceus]|uniref:hypothetical protein n=1 Tax=Streptomyces vinaceus TaxID=1960 RepID=UPI003823CA9D
MYLVHAELRPAAGADLPPRAAELIADCAEPGDGVEHVVFHARAQPGPVVGLFVRAEGVAGAERAAEAVCRRALAAQPGLAGFALRRVGVRIVPGFYDQQIRDDPDGRDMTRQD